MLEPWVATEHENHLLFLMYISEKHPAVYMDKVRLMLSTVRSLFLSCFRWNGKKGKREWIGTETGQDMFSAHTSIFSLMQ